MVEGQTQELVGVRWVWGFPYLDVDVPCLPPHRRPSSSHLLPPTHLQRPLRSSLAQGHDVPHPPLSCSCSHTSLKGT